MLCHGLAAHKTERNGAGAWPIRHGQDSSNQPISRPCQPMPLARSSRPAKKPVVQRLMLETQVRGLAAVFGLRLPRGLSPAFVQEVLDMSNGVADLPAAMRALIAARGAVLSKTADIDADIKHLVRQSKACRRFTSVPCVELLAARAFAAAIDDPARFRRSRDLGANRGLGPRRHQSGGIDLTWHISKTVERLLRCLDGKGCARSDGIVVVAPVRQVVQTVECILVQKRAAQGAVECLGDGVLRSFRATICRSGSGLRRPAAITGCRPVISASKHSNSRLSLPSASPGCGARWSGPTGQRQLVRPRRGKGNERAGYFRLRV